MILKRRQKTDDARRNESGSSSETVVLGRLEIGSSVEAAGDLSESTGPDHSPDRGPIATRLLS
jgi:hypothetical protein